MGAEGIRPGRVLIVGLGISGMATAIRLHRLGWEPATQPSGGGAVESARDSIKSA